MPVPNRLSNSASSYLLQHAEQPIDWYPWGAVALSKAIQEDKPILLSSGYAACHWCHVMAQETFEDPAVAAIMNQHFVCIKIDREERPDIDQLYVAALQAMGLRIGWPLHAFLLTNQQPFYGGTYFANSTWKALLAQIATAFQQHRPELEASAVQFTKTLYAPLVACEGQLSGIDGASLYEITIAHIFHAIYPSLDHVQGGVQGAPKFPMPSVGTFLLHYYRCTRDQRAWEQLALTLNKMVAGGMYDQLGGGFCRYATDEAWLVPHFEKMIYDNALLISLYAQAYLINPCRLYRDIIEQTISYIEKEMMHAQGGFYGSVNADSDGREGKFYIWTLQEVKHVIGVDISWFVAHYLLIPYMDETTLLEDSYTSLGMSVEATFSHGNGGADAQDLTLHTPASAAQQEYLFGRNPYLSPSMNEWEKLQVAKQALLAVRSKGTKPQVDNKILASWNGMMIQALVDAYYALDMSHFLELACKNAGFIQQQLLRDGQLRHTYYQDNEASNSYLEDYAWIARAFISLYQATFEDAWLLQAAALVEHAIQNFWEDSLGFFYSTGGNADALIVRPWQVFDEAIPSPNAVMAHNLLCLDVLLGGKNYDSKVKQMISRIIPLLQENPLHLTHWASLYGIYLQQVIGVAVVGPQYKVWSDEIKRRYPEAVVAGAAQSSTIPFLIGKQAHEGRSGIYLCHGQTCRPPVYSLEEGFQLLSEVIPPAT